MIFIPPHIVRWGKKAILSLTEGAKAKQRGELPSLMCPNSSSLAESGDQVTDTIAAGINKGFIAGPFLTPPLRNFRSNPMNGVKQKEKIRLVMDLSRPSGNCYNENIQQGSSRSVTMSSARQFGFSIMEAGKGAIMSKHDWSDAYKNVPVRIEDLRLQGFSWLGRYFVELSLVFGSINSVEEFDNLGELVLALACHLSSFPRRYCHRTLDDVPVVAPSGSGLTERFSTAYLNLCSELNIKLAPNCPDNNKAFTCKTEGTVLGFRFDSSSLSWSFPTEKADNLLRKIALFQSKRTTNLKTVQEIAGSLEHIGSMIPFSKAFRLPLYLFIRKFKSSDHVQLLIPQVLRSDLAIWANMIVSSKRGLPIPTRPSLPPLSVFFCTSDAAGIDLSLSPADLEGQSFGAASILHSRDNSEFYRISRIFWPDHFIFYAEDNKGSRLAAKSSTLEAIGVILPFISFPDLLTGSNVVLYVDNMSLIHGWNKRYLPNDIEASVIVRALHILSNFIRCRVFIRHAPRMSSPAATLADHLSRSSSTSESEVDLANSLSHPPKSPALREWLRDPKVDWNLPMAMLADIRNG